MMPTSETSVEVVHLSHRVVGGGAHGVVRQRTCGEGEDAQTLLGHLLVGVEQVLADLVHRDGLAVPQRM